MPVTLTAADEAKLKKVHPDLVKVIRQAAKTTTVPFRIMETSRSAAQQEKNIKAGVSKTRRSRHIVSKDGLCRAADIVPMVDGKVSWAWPMYYKLAPVMKAAAKAVGVPVEWGGDWKTFRDGPHWQLPWAKYP